MTKEDELCKTKEDESQTGFLIAPYQPQVCAGNNHCVCRTQNTSYPRFQAAAAGSPFGQIMPGLELANLYACKCIVN